MLHDQWVILAHPDLVTEAFSHGPEAVDSGEALRVLRPVIGTRNVLLMDGDEHLQRRRIALPAFHGDHIRAYEPAIRQAVKAEMLTWPMDRPFPVLQRLEVLAFLTVLSCILGPLDKRRMSTLATSLLKMLDWIMHPRRLLVLFFAGPDHLIKLPSFQRQIRTIDAEILAEIARRRTIADLPHQDDDVLTRLVRAQDKDEAGLSDIELRDELLTLLVAGHKNTAALLAWTLHELARNPDSQERLAREPDAFVDAVITETLRIRPPVPLIARRLRVPMTIAGYELAAGTNLGPCALLIQRRPDLYSQSLTFKPERFIDRQPPSSEWFPFGSAVHRCIGASFARFEARIILEEIIQTMRITPDRPRSEQARPQAIVLVPSRGARIVARRRKQSGSGCHSPTVVAAVPPSPILSGSE